MINKILVVFIMFLLLIPLSLAVADTEYLKTGEDDGKFQRGEAQFNTGLTSDSTSGNVVLSTTGRQHPIVADFDDDSGMEIAILDGLTIKIYEDSTLDFVSSAIVPGTVTDRVSNMIAFDIDQDSKKEIILVNEIREQLYIYELNSSGLKLQKHINGTDRWSIVGSPSQIRNGEITIACKDDGIVKCLMTYTDDWSTGWNSNSRDRDYYASAFDSTQTTGEIKIDDTGTGTYAYCKPRYRSMAIEDYDNDGDDEFIDSVIQAQAGTSQDEIPKLFYIQVSDNLTVTLENSFVEAQTGNLWERVSGSSTSTCDGINSGILTVIPGYTGGLPQDFITNPVVDDFKTDDPGLETALMYFEDADTDHFNTVIKVYNGCDGGASCAISEIDDFPELCDTLNNCGTGITLSNLISTKINPDTSVKDACGIGYGLKGHSVEDADMICANTAIDDTLEAILSVVPFNISTDYMRQDGLIHSLDSFDNFFGSININEITSPFGVMRIVDADTISPDLEVIYTQPGAVGVASTAIITSDVEQTGSEDILSFSSTNLFYVDDGITNRPARITNVLQNPCSINYIIKINSSGYFDITVEDQNVLGSQDSVSLIAVAYADTDNEHGTTALNVSSGTTIRAFFEYNQTIVNGIVRLQAFDSANPGDIDEREYTLNVQPNGIELDDVTCEDQILLDELEDDEELTGTALILDTDPDDNPVINTMSTLKDILGIGGTLLWLIIMLTIALGIWFHPISESNPSISLGAIILSQILMLIIGTILGILSVGIIISVIVIAVVILGVWVSKGLNRSNS